MSHRVVVEEALSGIWAEYADGTTMPTWTDGIVLLESGLDSLGFAVLIVELEDRVGFDPFTETAEAVYPKTFGEFVAFYDSRIAPS